MTATGRDGRAVEKNRAMAAAFLKRLGAACVAAALAACGGPPPVQDGVRPGGVFPALVMTALDGASAPLAGYRGRLVVLNVWATWCGPCREELPSLDRLAQRLDQARFAVIGLAVDDDRDVVREFLIERNVRFTSYVDPGMDIARDVLELRAFPATYVISPEGRLLRVVVGGRTWDGLEIVAALQAAYEGDAGPLAGV